jgi:uncharacterized protein involved in response to NO
MMTRGERMLALRRARMEAAPPILRGGFRPFFLGGAIWAVAALAIWILALAGRMDVPSGFDALSWHRHEMLFGFVGAVIAGFLLTAIPNWTGRLPIAGPPLAALFALWVTGRVAVFFSDSIGLTAAALVDAGFYFVFAALAAREVFAANNRNVPVVGLVLLLGVANALDHAGQAGLISDAGLGARAGIALVIMMISLIGGRIVPSFTRNWLAKRKVREGLPGQPGKFDLLVIAATLLAVGGWAVAPDGEATGPVLIGAAALQAIRLARWRGYRTFADPLVLILHVGYAWVPIGLALLGFALLGAGLPPSGALHALTAGAMATMILAVMTRATLGHTGRELKAGPGTSLIYLMITIGAVLRVAAPLGLLPYRIGMEVSAVAWAGAFLLFIAVYGPILMGSQPAKTA